MRKAARRELPRLAGARLVMASKEARGAVRVVVAVRMLERWRRRLEEDSERREGVALGNVATLVFRRTWRLPRCLRV
jgi:hypothetical protein